MDFKEREVDFREAERRYAELERQREAGAIDERQFDAQRRRLMVQDEEGRWWIRSRETGEWLYHDGNAWVRGTPPGYREAAPERTPPERATYGPQTPPPPSRRDGAGDGGNRRRRIPLWIPVVGFGAIVLLGLVAIAWMLVPSLRGELAFFGQGDPASSGRGEPMSVEQGDPAASGVAFDTVFVHRATSDNITANSTYLDEDLINDNPNAIVYVTPNWNPGGEGNTYNDHATGVWFDAERQRWAIFNQDREPMPEGAAFNVAVLAQPPG